MKKKMNLENKIHVKIGEKVRVISGDDKGKVGLVRKIIKQNSKIIVEGINIKIKHLKAKKSDETGQINRIEFPIHSSNVSKCEE